MHPNRIPKIIFGSVHPLYIKKAEAKGKRWRRF